MEANQPLAIAGEVRGEPREPGQISPDLHIGNKLDPVASGGLEPQSSDHMVSPSMDLSGNTSETPSRYVANNEGFAVHCCLLEIRFCHLVFECRTQALKLFWEALATPLRNPLSKPPREAPFDPLDISHLAPPPLSCPQSIAGQRGAKASRPSRLPP
eukprot:gene6236-2856_t